VCLVDEWELMPAEIAMGMQNLLEDGGYLYLKEKPGTSEERTVTPADNFRLVFAGNTVGQGDTSGAFTGVGVQNTATIDRFTSTVHLTYLDAKHEIAIITGKTGAPKEVAANMVKLATMVRNAYNSGKLGLTMSPRTLINWGRKMQRYGIQDGFSVAFVQKLNEDDKVSVMEFYKKVF
jgi:MoxR-like ATPase